MHEEQQQAQDDSQREGGDSNFHAAQRGLEVEDHGVLAGGEWHAAHDVVAAQQARGLAIDGHVPFGIVAVVEEKDGGRAVARADFHLGRRVGKDRCVAGEGVGGGG